MRITRIYCEATLQAGLSIPLDEPASHHLSRVLRCKAGDSIILFNGDGAEFQATITAIDRKAVTVLVGEESHPTTESPLAIHLGIAVSKGDRFDWVLQKATELGVTAITPLITERTEFKLKGDRQEKKLRHWRQVVVSACEQCGRNKLPELAPPTALPAWLEATDAALKLVLHHRSARTLPGDSQYPSVALLVGPEGGLSDDEIALAESRQFASLLLGPRVMRTETAPLAAIAVLQSRWGDF